MRGRAVVGRAVAACEDIQADVGREGSIDTVVSRARDFGVAERMSEETAAELQILDKVT